MDNLLELFLSKGESANIEGNHPIILDSSNDIWMIVEGKADVFVVEIDNRLISGRRSYQFSVSRGSILFGNDIPKNKKNFALVAFGSTGSKAVRVSRDIIFKSMDGQLIKELEGLCENWIMLYSESICKKIHPKELMVIENGKDYDIKKGSNIRPIEGVSWILHESGTSYFIGETEVNEITKKYYFPITSKVWAEINVDSKIKVVSTSELGNIKEIFNIILEFNSVLLLIAILNFKEFHKIEESRLKKKSKNELKYVQIALTNLAGVVSRSKEMITEEIEDDLLYKACYIVGKAMGIDVRVPASLKKGKEPANLLDEITSVSRMRYRQIILKGTWWKSDNGPILAWIEENEKPVALVPDSPGKYFIYDPYTNKKKIVDQNVAYTLKPEAIIFYKPLPSGKLGFIDLLRLGLKSCGKRDFVLLLIIGIATGLLEMVTPISTSIIFDSIIPESRKTALWFVSMFLFMSGIASIGFLLVRSFLMLRIESCMDNSIQSAVWDRVLSLPVPFFKKYSVGELVDMSLGINTIRKTLSKNAINSLLSALFSVFNFCLLFYYDVNLALIAASLVLLAIIITIYTGYLKTRIERKLIHVTNKLAGFSLQLIAGVSKFKVAGAEKRAYYLWARDYAKQRSLTFKSESIENTARSINTMYPVIASMVIMLSFSQFAKSELSVGNFIAFNAAFAAFTVQMLSLADVIVDLISVIPLFEHVCPIIKQKPEYDEEKIDPGALEGSIELSNVTFRYSLSTPPVIDSLDLTINPGEYVAFVGPSGCGKSTMFRILLGFENIESGKIYYDGQDVEKVDIRALRKQLGVVLQNAKIMAGDIFTNIVGSNPKLTIDDAWEAARAAGFDKDIEDMPMGMHTVLNDGATTLSGGQRQRLIIARAFVNKPRIVFFDEATSALDNKTQQIVTEYMNKIRATKIVIAHRLSTIMKCDRIIVLDKGRVIEDGNYDQLMDKKGFFYELASRQLA